MTGPLAQALLDAALRGVLLSLLLLLAGLLLRERPASPRRRVEVAMALGLCVQVIAATPAIDSQLTLGWLAPLVALSIGNAVLFWLQVRAMVDDEFVPRPRHALVWLAVVAFVWLNLAVVVRSGSPLMSVTLLLQRALPPFFALLTAFAAALHWRADLVEKRRWLRGFIVVAGVAYVFVTMFVRSRSAHGRLSDLGATFDAALLLAIVAVLAWRLLRLTDSDLFLTPALEVAPPALPAEPPQRTAVPASAPAQRPEPDPAEQRLADALQQAMQVERAYHTEDLTVAGLAARLAVPEYRLRRLINQRLGHRNFNAFVNGFRLAEARAALADPARCDLPILTIALEAGFQSIGPFNRAFKLATGVTPGEFRRAAQEKLADS